jgi:hypothetical protein
MLLPWYLKEMSETDKTSDNEMLAITWFVDYKIAGYFNLQTFQ